MLSKSKPENNECVPSTRIRKFRQKPASTDISLISYQASLLNSMPSCKVVQILTLSIVAAFSFTADIRAGIDSGGGIVTHAGLVNWNSIGEPIQTIPVTAGSNSIFVGQIEVLYTLATPPAPSNPDQDGDGLPDEWEMQYFGSISSTPSADADGDGASNLMEFLAGTIPNSSASVLRLSPNLSSGNLSVSVPTVSGRNYRLFFSTDLQTWSFVRSVGGDGSLKSITFTPANDDPQFATRTDKSKYFIRLEIQQP